MPGEVGRVGPLQHEHAGPRPSRHRAFDGGEAADLLADIKTNLETLSLPLPETAQAAADAADAETENADTTASLLTPTQTSA